MILGQFNLSERQKEQFKLYANFLIQENQKYNLTSIVDIEEVYIKHFYDSLMIKDVIDLSDVETFLDVGSGAGFPAIPIKIMYPNLKVTIIEPTKKRCNFLSEVCNLLDLKNVVIINDRSENISEENRDYFDVVTARAVASLPILLELTVPYVKVDGFFLALKGSSYEEELEASKTALKKLDAKLTSIYNYELPKDMGKRVILKIKKLKRTQNTYPRNYAAIKKKHL